MVLGRAMKVDYAQSNGSSPRSGGGKGGTPQPMTEKPPGCTTLFIANLSFEVNEDSLWEEFGKCGDVKAIRLATDRETGEYRGWICNNCNVALGRLNDDINALQNAIKYLRLQGSRDNR